jgi:ribonuclease HII
LNQANQQNGNVEVVGRDEKKLKEFCKNSDVKKYYLLNDWGYGTAAHREALDRLGVTRHHRRSFAPIRRLLCDGAETPSSKG